MRDGGEWRGLRAADDVEVRRQLRELVSVRHPYLRWDEYSKTRLWKGCAYLELLSEILEEGVCAGAFAADLGNLDLRKPVFTVVALRDLALHVPCHFLLSPPSGAVRWL